MEEKQIISYKTNNSHFNVSVFFYGELSEQSTCAKFAQVQQEGERLVSRDVFFYSLDMIIAVGYRVNSYEATHFRIWATNTLKEYIVKGFVLNDDMLKNGRAFGNDYFDELLDRIREIRASERRFYQKITDIYAQCSTDYDPNSPTTRTFYKTVQNKLHWAITGKTAAEIICDRASANKHNMGLTTWKNSPQGKISKADIAIAKNYLTEKEIKDLELIVNMYLDYAELQASRHIPMKMTDWATKLDAFLQFNEYQILNHSGKVSHEVAVKLAESEYDKFRVQQDLEYISDFDAVIKQINKQ